jgi:mannose-6-phosphate isomerase-like protein (cupin superfamily)
VKQIVEKGWGREIIFVNNEKYCGKLLCFDKAGSKGSMHFHGKKTETWYVQQGSFIVYYINTANANKCSSVLNQGDTWTNEVFEPHQLEALEDDSIVFEVSTHDDPHDSYRVEKGDSQS